MDSKTMKIFSIYTKHRIQSSYFTNTGFKNIGGHMHQL